MTHLNIQNLSVTLGGKTILREIDLQLEQGQIGCLLGPSGCGKTTLLRSIAGFEVPSQGDIHLQNMHVASTQYSTPVEQRQVGMMFQDFALFPHLTVSQNIVFGLRKQSRSQQKQRTEELLALTELEERASAYPHQLSGGQQQRVALARALAPRPDILLLDEPFSSIDSEMRESLAHSVRKIIKNEGVSALLVTHDQLEAFAMADQIGVMRAGQLQQWASAYELYHRPATRFVADFIGEGRLIEGKVLDGQHVETVLGVFEDEEQDFSQYIGQTVDLLLRPDDIIHDDNATLTANVRQKSFRGSDFLYRLVLAGGEQVLCYAPSHHRHELGEAIGIRVDMDHIVAFPKI